MNKKYILIFATIVAIILVWYFLIRPSSSTPAVTPVKKPAPVSSQPSPQKPPAPGGFMAA